MKISMTLLIAMLILIFWTPLQAIFATEEPAFKVIEKIDSVEIREISEYWIVEIEIEGSQEEAGNKAFRTLLKYISGENTGSEKIEMTAPVNQQSKQTGEKIEMTAPVNQTQSEEGKFLVSFVLPERFNSRVPPQPKDDRLKLRKIEKSIRAVQEYSGTWSIDNFNENKKILLDTLSRQDRWEISGAVQWSRYDAPFMPWFLRRNEVQVDLREK